VKPKESRTVTRTFSLTPHEEQLLDRITREWFGDRARTSSATIGRLIRDAARRMRLEHEEGERPPPGEPEDRSASELS